MEKINIWNKEQLRLSETEFTNLFLQSLKSLSDWVNENDVKIMKGVRVKVPGKTGREWDHTYETEWSEFFKKNLSLSGANGKHYNQYPNHSRHNELSHFTLTHENMNNHLFDHHVYGGYDKFHTVSKLTINARVGYKVIPSLESAKSSWTSSDFYIVNEWIKLWSKNLRKKFIKMAYIFQKKQSVRTAQRYFRFLVHSFKYKEMHNVRVEIDYSLKPPVENRNRKLNRILRWIRNL